MGMRLPKALEAEILARADKVGPSRPTDTELFAKVAKGKAAGRKVTGTTIPPVAWKAFGIPQPTREYRFCERRWRVDYAWVDAKVALEIEGGIWEQGRHNRPVSMIKEMAKYNRLSVLGWRLIRCTPQDVKDGSIFETVRQALK